MARTKNPARRTVGFIRREEFESAEMGRRTKEEARAEEREREAVSIISRARSRTSPIPSWTRFPAVLVMSLFLSSALYSVSAQWTYGELAGVSRQYEGWSVLAGLLGWRGTELALAWFGDYDSYDLLSLIIVAHGPPIYLLHAFYNVSSSTAITSIVIDALATYIPFRLLRPVSKAHKIFIELQAANSKPNEALVADYSIKAFTTILAATIYSTTLYTSYATFLPTTLVTYFNDIPTIAEAHNAAPITLLPLNLLLGFAAHTFIFTPAVVLSQNPVSFDPITAELGETIWYNLWGWSDRTKMVIKRTAALAGVVGVNGWLQTWATIKGVEAMGAALYAGVWMAGSLITGMSFALVADV